LQGFQGNQGWQGPKAAILKTISGYNEMSCIEAPEVLFFDIKSLSHSGMESELLVDTMFVEVCEPGTISAVSALADIPVAVGVVRVSDWKFRVQTGERCEAEIRVMLSGVRRGFMDRRFAERTEQEFKKNQEFWRSV
jgi:hypothetical protein